MSAPLCLRWTIGDLRPYGIQALRLSVWGAYRCFGTAARYVIGVHGVTAARARALASAGAGALPDDVAWHAIDVTQLPRWLRRVDVSARAARRFAPVLVDRARAELRLDRRCVLFATPPTLAAWLDDPNPRACAVLADRAGRPSTSLRGAGPGFDLEEALREAHRAAPRPLRSREDVERLELDALGLLEPPHVVSAREIGAPELGSHGVRLSPPREPIHACGPSESGEREAWERTLEELHARLDAPHASAARAR